MNDSERQITTELATQWPQADFWQWQRDYRPSAYWLGVSGGLDSMALMHLIATHRARISAPITVVYINHLWHDQAQAWGEFIQRQCQALALAFECQTVDYECVAPSSPEAMARQARYQCFAKLMTEKAVLLTAHHQDDQAETVLLQLLRGSGLAGLASMPARARFANGEHWRPLLGFSRDGMAKYVQHHNIPYLNDPSNDDSRYQRNWLRQEVMPILTAKQPKAAQNLARSATWLAEALTVQSQLLSSYFSPDTPDHLDVRPWLDKPLGIQKALLREWLRRLGIAPLPHAQQHEFLDQVRQQTGHPTLIHGGYALVSHDAYISVYRHVAIAPPPEVTRVSDWSGIGELNIHTGAEKLLALAGERTWSLYPPGGVFRPAQKGHHHQLKEWFRRARIPPYVRKRTPILRLNDQIIWVGGLGSAFGYEWLGINWQKKAHSVSISSYPLSGSDNS